MKTLKDLKPPMPEREFGDRCAKGLMPPLAPKGTDPKSIRSWKEEKHQRNMTEHHGDINWTE